MKKYKLPTVEQFLEKKTIYGPKKDPIWVTLEKEMVENADIKPYNEKVGSWLSYLKELKQHFHCESKKKEKQLKNEVGPSWYFELSSPQRKVLSELKSSMHQDLIEDLPVRTKKSLTDLGITLKLPKTTLMKAMQDSVEDPGIFIWNLYTAIYKTTPSEIKSEYDMNAMILMSSLVFIDLEECTQTLEKLTAVDKAPLEVKKKKPKQKTKPSAEEEGYLQKSSSVPLYSNRPSAKKEKQETTEPLTYKLKLKSDESYEKLCVSDDFLEKRKERNIKELQPERVCNYKFWEPPSTLRNTDPSKAAYVNKLKMIKLKAKIKFKAPYNNIQYHIGGVSYSGGKPNYVLHNVGLLPTGYIPINGGNVLLKTGEYVVNILGFWKFPRDMVEKCDKACDCLAQWESVVMDYLEKSKCKCGHLYDYNYQRKVIEKYFYPPTRHTDCWFDKSKIYQLDPTEDFIKETVRLALLSKEPTPKPSHPTLSPAGMKEKDLLKAFLGDLADTPLIIPHLPKAHLLNNLQEWVRRRVKGKITPQQTKKLKLKSQRRWLDLKHMDFRARAFQIPFTQEQLKNMNWSHRKLVQNLFQKLLNDFVERNRKKQLEQTRLWWATTKHDTYPSKAFLDIFFTYMPGRMQDIYLLNPYSSALTPKSGAKTCPLNN